MGVLAPGSAPWADSQTLYGFVLGQKKRVHFSLFSFEGCSQKLLITLLSLNLYVNFILILSSPCHTLKIEDYLNLYVCIVIIETSNQLFALHNQTMTDNEHCDVQMCKQWALCAECRLTMTMFTDHRHTQGHCTAFYCLSHYQCYDYNCVWHVS